LLVEKAREAERRRRTEKERKSGRRRGRERESFVAAGRVQPGCLCLPQVQNIQNSKTL